MQDRSASLVHFITQIAHQMLISQRFDDCLKLRRRIDERPYLLPDPEILRRDPSSMKHNLTSYDDIRGATDPTPSEMPSSSASADKVPKLHVFQGKKIMFSADLGISNHLMATIERHINNGGGNIVSRLCSASTYVCRYRDAYDFISAFTARKEIGNLAWLYYLITHNVWTSPTRRLLHYPVPRRGIPGFEGTKISISNYTGEGRIYLENLVRAAGGIFTKTMKQENTHLITAHMNSEKCEAAREWNIHIVNHLWLEESYQKCEMQTVSNPRYITFPSRTNLGEVLGRTQIDDGVIEEQFPDEPQLPSEADAMDVDQDGPEPVLDDDVPAVAGDEESFPAKSSNTAKPKKKLKNSRTENAARTPAAPRFADGKENETPSTTGSRSAKQRAISALHDAADDIAQFQKESKRVGGVTHGRPKSRDGLPAKEAESKKRQTPDDETENDGDASMEDVEMVGRKGAKRAKTAGVKEKKPPIGERLMVTKYDKWVEKPQQEPIDRVRVHHIQQPILLLGMHS